MADDDRVRTLLRAAATIEGSQPAPVDRLVAAGRRSVRRRRVAVATLAVCATATVVVVPTVVMANRAHHFTATGPTDSSQSSPPPLPTAASPLATISAYPTTGPGTATALAHARWSALPDAPIAGRRNAASTWTGTQMLVWGGATDTAALGDGASYDPATRSWQTLPQSPLAPRTGIASVWTGSQWFLWGGQHGVDVSGDGAMYEPATRSWSPLPASPLSARGGATAVWTGTEVLVLGGYGKGREADRIDGAAYNPATRSWRRVAPNPAVPQPRVGDAQFTVATTVGPSVYVANNWSRTETVGGDTGTRSGVALARYDPWLDTWTALDNPQQHQGIGRLIWTGRELLVPASQIWCGACSHPAPMGSHGRRLDVGTGTWREVPHGPLDDLTPVDVWTGSALVAPAIGGSSSGPDGTVTEGDSAAWDPTTNKWVALPHAPISEVDVSLWTGRQLLLWGLPYSSSAKGVGASLG